jgi:hypothetical protein|tara:strand:+ start:5671 stop:6321 length:651 start_codon:yes stop_codon:yes gene_type:complete
MITDLNIKVDTTLIQSALDNMSGDDFRLTLNEPTGDFFYDPWTIKDEFKNTPWGQLLGMLPFELGEARIANLAPMQTLAAHADIDDRWHLALTNENSFLINLDDKTMHECEIGTWYSMNAGTAHTATNFGVSNRIHLLVRQLLTNSKLQAPKTYTITADTSKLVPHRYIFDMVFSPILHKLNIDKCLSNFVKTELSVSFDTEEYITLPNNENFIIT